MFSIVYDEIWNGLVPLQDKHFLDLTLIIPSSLQSLQYLAGSPL